MQTFKFYVVLYIAKLIKIISNLFNIGSGYTWPGHVALKLCSELFTYKSIKFNKGIIFVSGTNGKTTTAKLITHALQGNNFTVLNNTTGANLANGIASTLLLGADFFGRLNYDYGVFEIDEFALPFLLGQKPPDILVLLNLSRDQLDRYGETDIIFSRWQGAIANLPVSTKIVAFKNQPEFNALQKSFKGSFYTFSENLDVLQQTKLKGSFNALNVAATLQTCMLLGINSDGVLNTFADFDLAYGRGEVILYDGKSFHIYLAKNPASFNSNLPLLSGYNPQTTALLFILNDNIPDGRDVSWIYDIDASLLFNNVSPFKHIYFSGTRYLDMAIRLKYAGLAGFTSASGITVDDFTSQPDIVDVVVFPNYSAMLEIRKILLGRSIL